jgi:alginate O-acetyltransferase complex protein AlgJ
MTEKKQKLSREDIAKMEIGNTQISRALTIVVCILFLALIAGYPMLQIGYEIVTGKRKVPQAFEIFFSLSKPMSQNSKDDLIAANEELLSKINRYEDDLEDNSLLLKHLLPSAQKTLLDVFKIGNEKVFIGTDGFLFFQSGIKYLTNPGFLNPDILKKRTAKAEIQADPRKAIIQFKNQLAKRNIKLIIVPTPVKPMIYPDKFSSMFKDFSAYLQNPSFAKFKQEMEQAGVMVFDPAPILAGARQKAKDVFLKTDTHWTPYGMERVAMELKNFIDLQITLSAKVKQNYNINTREVANLGDIALMLKLRNPETHFIKQKVEIKEVVQGKNIFRNNRNSEILLLGDSFTNIFSLGTMGWGENAGFVEHLAFQFKRPIDVITRNDAGAYATREILDNELKKGRNRLAGKKLVIWQFAIRELLDGNWKLLKMELGQKTPSTFFVPKSNIPVIVKAMIVDISSVPRPGLVPYKDHIMSLHLTNVSGVPGLKKIQSLVYIRSMKDGKLTPAARLRQNQEIRIKLSNWQNVENKYSRLNRSDLANDDIALENPCWGELIDEK